MKNYLIFLIIIVIGFTSCENRKSKSQALSESVKEFKKTVNLETNVFIPDTYFEHEVDTLISNGYRVKIKTYTDMSNSVLFSKIKDTINYQTYYRNFKFDITVSKNEKVIYQENFNKEKVNKAFNYNPNLVEGSDLYNFDKLAILKFIQVNDDPTYKNMVVIDILYAIPESDKSASHTLFINSKGKSNIVQIEVK
ncbi:hypothetical protein HSX10_04280 [Winogradskyella undariae]|uniref:hypothetical protein n=1 Tax=Winogradskyella TaxID=286104 RepID=UPI00156B2838|nr:MULTISPECIES: hypothetical protein [Winogradskyella]NRR90780.1 hypothetical protein [Winogradskyella undariae]QXP79447.1 hypothetical protein H0I32_02065 [Winogradskyella sp. HaHa_3_26]